MSKYLRFSLTSIPYEGSCRQLLQTCGMRVAMSYKMHVGRISPKRMSTFSLIYIFGNVKMQTIYSCGTNIHYHMDTGYMVNFQWHDWDSSGMSTSSVKPHYNNGVHNFGRSSISSGVGKVIYHDEKINAGCRICPEPRAPPDALTRASTGVGGA